MRTLLITLLLTLTGCGEATHVSSIENKLFCEPLVENYVRETEGVLVNGLGMNFKDVDEVLVNQTGVIDCVYDKKSRSIRHRLGNNIYSCGIILIEYNRQREVTFVEFFRSMEY